MGVVIFFAAIIGAVLYVNLFDRRERGQHWSMLVFAFLVVFGGGYVIIFIVTLITDGPAAAFQMLGGDAAPSPYY